MKPHTGSVSGKAGDGGPTRRKPLKAACGQRRGEERRPRVCQVEAWG